MIEDLSAPNVKTAPLWLSVTRVVLRIVVIAGAAWCIHQLFEWVMDQAAMPSSTMHFGIILVVLLAYACLIAIPFVPGIEIGVGLLLMSGAQMAPIVYLATVAGLLIAFSAGRLLPYTTLHRVFADLRFKSACRMLESIETLSPERRMVLLREKLPAWLAPLATKYRYLSLAILINLPGNALLGGGGGLALVAGISGLYRVRATILTFALAVAPVPILVWLTGTPGLWFAG